MAGLTENRTTWGDDAKAGLTDNRTQASGPGKGIQAEPFWRTALGKGIHAEQFWRTAQRLSRGRRPPVKAEPLLRQSRRLPGKAKSLWRQSMRPPAKARTHVLPKAAGAQKVQGQLTGDQQLVVTGLQTVKQDLDQEQWSV